MVTVEFIEGEWPLAESATEAGSGAIEDFAAELSMLTSNMSSRKVERVWSTFHELEAKHKELEAQLAEATLNSAKEKRWAKEMIADSARLREQLAEANARKDAAIREHFELHAQIDRAIDNGIADTHEANARAEKAEAQLAAARKELNHWKREFSGNMPSSEIDARVVAANERAEKAEAKAEGWQNRCQEVMAKLDSQSYLFMKLELDAAKADAARLREDCAKIADEYAEEASTWDRKHAAEDIAEAIRAITTPAPIGGAKGEEMTDTERLDFILHEAGDDSRFDIQDILGDCLGEDCEEYLASARAAIDVVIEARKVKR